MAIAVGFNCLPENLCEKVHNLGADSLKVMLSNVAPSVANTIKSNITEIAAGNGYTAGGAAITISSSTQTAGTYKLVLADVTFLAAGGTMATFQYAVVYNDTPTSPLDPVMWYYNYGAPISLATGQDFKVDFSPTDGALVIGPG